MTIDLFATQITGLTQGNSNTNAGFGLPIGGKGLNADFLDMLLGHIEIEETKNNKVLVKTSENADLAKADLIQGDAEMNALIKEKGDLALLKLALLGQTSNENIEEQLADLKIERLDNRVNHLSKLIDHLTNGLPANVNNSGSVEALVSRLQERIDNLEARMDLFRAGGEAGEEAFPLLIATGLNPSQLTSITNRIEEVENKLGRELTAEDLIAGVGNIIPAPGSDEKLSVTDMIGLAEEFEGNEELLSVAMASTPMGTLAQQLNKINVGGTPKGSETATDGESESIGGATPEALIGVDGEGLIAVPVSNTEFNALKGKGNKALNNIQGDIANLANLTNASNPLISGFNGGIALPENWQTFFAEAFEALGINIDTGIPVSHTMLAAHVSTNVSQAGQAHAATQTVAANMHKAAQNGGPTDMTIQLDPPELGRVEVKLEFGPEKTIKASVVVEKPETFLLLQKDAGALERALQNAGLETDAGSLNFEMAADNYAFGGGDKEGGNNGQYANGGASNDAEDDSEIINTTMTWDVDPDTGHVHYNIMA